MHTRRNSKNHSRRAIRRAFSRSGQGEASGGGKGWKVRPGHLSFERLESLRMLSGMPALLADLNPGLENSSPQDFVESGDSVFFTAVTADNGRELWKTDGTADGTVLVKDILPGTSSSSPANLVDVDGTLFFRARTNDSGQELWKSDGTADGTVLVKDINPGTANSYANDLTNVDGTLFFRANDGVGGQELWKSDGTEDGTTLVEDIFPGATSSYPIDLINVGGTLFFRANSPDTGRELWTSDGTAEGTSLVKDINPGTPNAYPINLVDVDGTLFFRARDADNGQELWKSDGTADGTVLVKDINPGTGNSSPREMANVNGTLFFRATDGTTGQEVWKSDGTADGTVLVADINPGPSNSSPRELVNVNGTLFFRASVADSGRELWKSDGTADGTMLVKDINVGVGDSYPVELTAVDGTLFFRANETATGRELWMSDGTEEGTQIVEDIVLGPDNSYPLNLAAIDSTLYFSATGSQTGREPWILSTADNIAPSADILNVTPDPRDAGIETLTVVFSEPVTGFDLSDVILDKNGDGKGNLLGDDSFTDEVILTQIDNVTYEIGGLLGRTSTDGEYFVRIDASSSGIEDADNNDLVEDANEAFVVDTGIDDVPPTADIVDVVPDPVVGGVGVLTIVFSEPVSGFGLEDLVLDLTGDGKDNLLTDPDFVVPPELLQIDDVTFELGGLTERTETPGQYTLTLVAEGSEIVDNGGNALAGDAVEEFEVASSADVTPPTVSVVPVTPDPTNFPVASLTIVFSEPVTGFDLTDLNLDRANDGRGNLLTDPAFPNTISLTQLDDVTYILAGLAERTIADGAYNFRVNAVGSGIQDLAGNALAAKTNELWSKTGAGNALDDFSVDPALATGNFDRLFNGIEDAISDFVGPVA